jgi:hypothetical protein
MFLTLRKRFDKISFEIVIFQMKKISQIFTVLNCNAEEEEMAGNVQIQIFQHTFCLDIKIIRMLAVLTSMTGKTYLKGYVSVDS